MGSFVIHSNEAYAKALENYNPSVVMGETGRGGNELLSLLAIKVARDLGLEMNPPA